LSAGQGNGDQTLNDTTICWSTMFGDVL